MVCSKKNIEEYSKMYSESSKRSRQSTRTYSGIEKLRNSNAIRRATLKIRSFLSNIATTRTSNEISTFFMHLLDKIKKKQIMDCIKKMKK